MIDARLIRSGMVVRSAEGEKLGKVLETTADGFLVEKGLFFPKDYFCRFEDVTEIRGDEIHTRYSRDDLEKIAATGAVAEPSAAPLAEKEAAVEHRIPLSEEELIAEKHAREAVEVRVHKEVVTEEVPVSVPVTREEVKVEKVPTERAEAATEGAFEETEVRVPIMEEEVELRKRPVTREEVRISKEPRREEVSATEQVRREEVEIEEAGQVRKAPSAAEEEREGMTAGERKERGRR